ncbi:MAG: endonuclease domain-containing protein [Patescibacteria group bacterium]
MQDSDYKEFRRDLRKNATEAKKLIWPHLQEFRWKGYPIRRQYSIGTYIVDFYCPKARLAIEIDGSIHDTDMQKGYDEERDIWIEADDIKVIRFTNQEVKENLEQVLAIIEKLILSN